MTVYVCDNPYQGRFHLWGDTPEEAEGFVWAVGYTPHDVRRHDLNSWAAYLIPPEALAEALGLGAVLTDKFGPAEWCAWRDKRPVLLQMIERARKAGVA